MRWLARILKDNLLSIMGILAIILYSCLRTNKIVDRFSVITSICYIFLVAIIILLIYTRIRRHLIIINQIRMKKLYGNGE